MKENPLINKITILQKKIAKVRLRDFRYGETPERKQKETELLKELETLTWVQKKLNKL